MFTLFHWHDGFKYNSLSLSLQAGGSTTGVSVTSMSVQFDEELRFLRCCARLLMLRLLPAGTLVHAACASYWWRSLLLKVTLTEAGVHCVIFFRPYDFCLSVQ